MLKEISSTNRSLPIPRLSRKEPTVATETPSIDLKDTAKNPFRIKPPEGQMMAVMKGNPDGGLDRIVASISGWHFRYQEVLQAAHIQEDNPHHSALMNIQEWEKWQLLPDFKGGKRIYTPSPKEMPEEEFGIIMVGLGKALHVPHLQYAKWEKKSGSVETGLVSKEREDSPFFYFQYTLGIPVQEVESTGNIKTTVNLNVVVRLVNPYKALFLAGGWESLLNGAVHGAVRDHISHLTIENIRAEEEKGKLSKRILKLNRGFRKNYGIELQEVHFIGYNVVGSTRVTNALEEEEVSRLNANAAKHQGDQIRTLGNAKAAELKAMTEALGGNSRAAAEVKVAEHQKEGMIQTNATVISIGGGSNSMPLSIPVPPPNQQKRRK